MHFPPVQFGIMVLGQQCGGWHLKLHVSFTSYHTHFRKILILVFRFSPICKTKIVFQLHFQICWKIQMTKHLNTCLFTNCKWQMERPWYSECTSVLECVCVCVCIPIPPIARWFLSEISGCLIHHIIRNEWIQVTLLWNAKPSDSWPMYLEQ